MNQNNSNKAQLHRQQWKKKTLKKSMQFFFIYTASSQLIFVILFVLGILTINSISNIQGFAIITNTLKVVLILLILLMDLFFVVYTYFDITNFYYILKAGKYQFTQDIIDTKPGMIIIVRGILTKSKKITPVSQFHKTRLYQGIFGNIFNYGNILILDEKGKVKMKLTNINNPQKYISDIHNMISNYKGMKMLDPNFGDILRSEDQTPRPINRPPVNP